MTEKNTAQYFVVQTFQEESTGVDIKLVPCEDSRAVHKAIIKAQKSFGGDWRLFELVNGLAIPRTVVFKFDGRVSYDVEIR